MLVLATAANAAPGLTDAQVFTTLLTAESFLLAVIALCVTLTQADQKRQRDLPVSARALAQLAAGGNVRLVRFAIPPRSAEVDDDSAHEDLRPALRAVRFEGKYLFDSRPAAQLMARDQRALVDITVQVSTTIDDKVGKYPIRIAIEGNHVHVATGLGADLPQHAGAAHARAVQAVTRALEAGIRSSTLSALSLSRSPDLR